MNLKDFGIEQNLNILGSYKILLIEKNAPIVFLIDEHHDNINNCIDNNILNAKELLEKGNVSIIGVESLAGGKKWDEEINDYSEEGFADKLEAKYYTDWKSSCTKFADELNIDNLEKVFGVECIGMMNKIETDLYDGVYECVTNHPLNRKRSKHFIRTLFEKRNELKLEGNIVLNCGSNHNSDIESMIISGKIEEIADCKASYIRLNAIEHFI